MNYNKIVKGSCFDLIKQLPDNSIDLIVTSPPYADTKSYGKNINVLHPDNYNDWILPLIIDSYRVLKESGSFILNINDKIVNKNRHTYALELPCRVVKESELSLYDRYFWNKPGIPNGGKKRLNNFTEFIYHFVKNENEMKFNIDSVREEYTAESIRRYQSSPILEYKTDEKGIKTFARYKEKRELCPKGKIPEGLFRFPSNSNTCGNKHPAPFSIELPMWFIKALTDEDDIVLDPFMGSGTTAEASIKLNRQWIGFELNEEYVKITEDRTKHLDLFQ